MGTITTGIGLISGIDTATLIDQLIAIESRPKISLQERLALLQSQQAAMFDINARLLNLKTTSKNLRTNKVFQSALVSSSNKEVLKATATGSPQPGTYTFLVKQIVSSSQVATRGFADTDSTPVGLSSLTFELGRGRLSTDTELGDLNGATGAARGRIVIADSVGTTTVDLRTATTINEVLTAINDSGANVSASVEGDHLVVTELSAGALSIANGTGYKTATQLGIAGSAPGGTITGTDIRTLGSLTPLAALNDGTGVVIVDANPDLHIESRNGTTVLDVDLGRADNAIGPTTLIEDLNDGSGITTNSDSTEDILFVDRDGVEHEVDLTGIVTVQDLMNRVFDQTDGAVTIGVHGDGDKLTVNDTTGGPGLLKVLGAGPNGTETAEDLGILETTGVDAASFDGSVLKNADHVPAASTIQNVIDRINNHADNGGEIVASIASDGVSLLITDTTGSTAQNLVVAGTAANPYAARDLGIEADVAADTIDGGRLIAGLDSVLVRSLNGGAGLGGNTSLTIQDRTGASDAFVIDEDGSISDIIALINASGAIDVTASLNEAGNGLRITDNTASTAANLVVSGNAAAELGIEADVAADAVRGTSLQHRYVAEGTRLSALNYGRGIGQGTFRITDGDGDQVTIAIDADQVTVRDLIAHINALASAADVDVTARVNDNGDGLALDNDLGTGIIKVETIGGSTAANLRLAGEAETDGGGIDGSYEVSVGVNASDTIEEIVQAINEAGVPVDAATLNTGAGATPFQLVFTSKIAGTAGALIVDDGGFGLGLTTLSKAQDSKVFFGSSDPAVATLVKRSSSTLDKVLPGVSIDLVAASDKPVTLTVSRDTQTIEDKIGEFVAAFNDAVGRLDQYDFYNVDAETKGVLLGNPTTARVRSALFRALQQKATGVTGAYRYLSQVGITVGAEGVLTFDRGKFQAAYEADPQAVESLFTAFKGATTTTEELSPGVTIDVTTQSFSELGVGDLFDQLMDGLTNSIDGTMTIASDLLDDQIDLAQNRIADIDVRLEAKRARLEHQYAAMEAALAQLQGQQSALASIVSNLSLIGR